VSSEKQRMAISVRGKQRVVPIIDIGGSTTVQVKGTFLKIAEVIDEFCLNSKELLEPSVIIEKLKQLTPAPDIFVFEQKIPDISPRFDYHFEWVNYAVAYFDSYSDWFEKKVDRSVRKYIRQSLRKGVHTKIVPFTDEFVMGICSIYNELKVRQGRRFWHYGKSFETVKNENGTYLDKSTFIGAYFGDELIGFAKIIFNNETAQLMQILSKSAYYDKRPTNAVLSKAVEICEEREVKYLIYGEYVYGRKEKSGLIDFKRINGFNRVDIPRYYVPITLKGQTAIRLGLHTGLAMWLPNSIRIRAINMREQLYTLIYKT
jgi:hypothetical protein